MAPPIELRQRWDEGIGYGDVAEVLDGKRALTGKQARWVAEAVAAAAGQVTWRCTRVAKT